MKKALKSKSIVLWSLLICIFLLCGCNDDYYEMPSDLSAAGDIISEFDTSDNITIDGSQFEIKEKKYSYNEQDVIILNIKNGSSKNYNISIDGSYIDESGKTIKSETKTLNGIASGYSSHLLFQPEITFHDFSYTLTVEECGDECYLSKVVPQAWNEEDAIFMAWQGPMGIDDLKDYYQLFTRFYCKNESDKALIVKGVAILMTDDDQILAINNWGYDRFAVSETASIDVLLYKSEDNEITQDKESWPANFQKKLTLLVIPTEAIPEEEMPDWMTPQE